MIIYNYDSITKEYTGYEEASIDPAETQKQGKEVYLIPANATTAKPPKVRDHEIIVYHDGWERVADYRGEYIVNSDMQPYVFDKTGNLPEGYIYITPEQAEKIQQDDLYYIIEGNKLVINPDYEEQKQAREEKEFNQQFFRTSLGYVRRTVTMKDGSTKDFLTDILPLLVVGVPVLVYSRELEQTRIQATEPFINECKQQLFIDFYGEE